MIQYVSGDPLLTDAPILAFGWNLRGRPETGALESALMQRYPTAFAAFSKRARQGQISIGTLWLWRETIPALGFMVVRDTPYGTTRLRHVEAIAMALARDYKRDGIQRLALVLPGQRYDRPLMRAVLERWLSAAALPVMVFEDYQPGVTPT
jgi:hypothetical protein